MRTFLDIIAVNTPNVIAVSVMTLSDIQMVATLALTLLSIVSTVIIIWLNVRRKK
jgi:hypothetical protein